MNSYLENEKNGGVQVISRVAVILNILGEHTEGLTLSQIAQLTKLPRSTVQRLVCSLESVEMLRINGKSGIALGPAFLKLISNAHTDIISAIQPLLESLAADTGETVALSRTSGRNLTVIHCAVSSGELQVVPRLGFARPLYQTAAGRVLLSMHEDTEVVSLFTDEFNPPDKFSIQSIPSLLENLREIRLTGVSYDFGEMIEGVNTLAVGLNTRIGRFSVSMPVPEGRYKRKHDSCVEAMVKFKEKLLLNIGSATDCI